MSFLTRDGGKGYPQVGVLPLFEKNLDDTPDGIEILVVPEDAITIRAPSDLRPFLMRESPFKRRRS